MLMNDYRFHLQKYRPGIKTSCPQCQRKACFTRYVDELGEITFPEHVGICDHQQSCGYHYPPKEYFKDNPEASASAFDSGKDFRPIATPPKPLVPPSPSCIDQSIVQQTLGHYAINPLYKYLSSVFGEKETLALMTLYNVGTSKKWGGSAVFWQTDINGNFRTGKVMCYDTKTGHRIKEPAAYVSWVHAELRLADFHLRQCLFGEHLLSRYPHKQVMIVESEKTALIAHHFMPDYLWLATGGKNGCFNREAMEVLRGRKVTLFPDLGCYDAWREKLPMIQSICASVSVSDILEADATAEQREQGLDIADFLLMSETKQQILQRMIARNPCLQLLIDKLQLEIVEE